MIIRVRSLGVEEAAASLNKNVRGKFTQAIRQALRAGQQEGRRLTDARYVRKINPLGRLRLRASGLHGSLTISGPRNPINKFRLRPATRPPNNPPGGLYVQILRGGGGQLPHAFIGKGKVLERTGASRLPIRRLTTVSTPGAWNVFSPQVEELLQRHLEKNLEAVL